MREAYTIYITIIPRAQKSKINKINNNTLTSSFGTTKPHPNSQGTNFFGLCSHSFKCEGKTSNLKIPVQPWD